MATDAPADLEPFLAPGRAIDSDHPAVRAFAAEHTRGLDDPREQAVALHLAVRDGFRYDPYHVDLSPEGFKASGVLERGAGYCTPKAALLAACARVVGIPSRIGFADVRNHLTSPRLREQMGTDEFVWHGFTELLLDGRWVKTTPAFNASLCERLGLEPLDFDGRTDAVLHAADRAGRRSMEYLRQHGTFADVPVEQIREALTAAYPYLRDAGVAREADSFEDEAVAPSADADALGLGYAGSVCDMPDPAAPAPPEG